MVRSSKSKTPDSLIDVLSEQIAREEAILEQVRQAHQKGDSRRVMVLLTQFFGAQDQNLPDGHE